jgi:hypothetical protein
MAFQRFDQLAGLRRFDFRLADEQPAGAGVRGEREEEREQERDFEPGACHVVFPNGPAQVRRAIRESSRGRVRYRGSVKMGR